MKEIRRSQSDVFLGYDSARLLALFFLRNLLTFFSLGFRTKSSKANLFLQ